MCLRAIRYPKLVHEIRALIDNEKRVPRYVRERHSGTHGGSRFLNLLDRASLFLTTLNCVREWKKNTGSVSSFECPKHEYRELKCSDRVATCRGLAARICIVCVLLSRVECIVVKELTRRRQTRLSERYYLTAL